MRSPKPSVAELRRVAQPPELIGRRSAEHWAGRAYMRRLSIYLTWAAVRARVSANALTGLMVLVGLLGAGAFAIRGVGGAFAGALLIQAYLLLDCSDGEVARWTDTTSAAGIYLDRLGHFLVEAGIFAALGLRAGGWDDASWAAWGLLVAVLHVLGKVETDLVEVARAKYGLPPLVDDEATAAPRRRGLSDVRRLAALLPVHRLTGAVESSLLILAAAIVDGARGSLGGARALTLAYVGIAIYVLVGHLAMILASGRLRK